MSEQPKWIIRQIIFKVRPAANPAEHPTYYDWEAGFLSLWLSCGVAESVTAAAGRASEILERLPYETIGTQVSVRACLRTNENPLFAQKEEEARQTGISLYISGVATGGDESGFETCDLP